MKKIWLLLGVILSCTAFAGTTSQTAVPLLVNLEQKYSGTTCDAGAPTGSVCLNVTGTGTIAGLGKVEMKRVVQIDAASADPKKGTTKGKLTFENGDFLNFRAVGNVMFEDGTASYNFIITGGTARFKNAIGGGIITVPPPSGSVRELWSGVLYLEPEAAK